LKTVFIAFATDLCFGASGTGWGRGESIHPETHPKP